MLVSKNEEQMHDSWLEIAETCEPQKVYHRVLHLCNSSQAIGSAKMVNQPQIRTQKWSTNHR